MAKDFGPIEQDYAFFMAHATEAAADLAEYVSELAGFAEGRSTLRVLDFGCGTGEFTERLLSALDWPASLLKLALIEPVRHQLESAAQRLVRFSDRKIDISGGISDDAQRFDLIVSNHVLYYVDDLDATLGQLTNALAPRGKLLLTLAGWDNALLELWKLGFAMLGQPVPYNGAEEVSAGLARLGASFRTTKAFFDLRFPDSAENRMKICRFLFANYLDELPVEQLAAFFDRYVRDGQVDIEMFSYHFTVGAL